MFLAVRTNQKMSDIFCNKNRERIMDFGAEVRGVGMMKN